MTDHEKVREIIRLKEQAPVAFYPHKSALLVVDVQRYFARPDYPFARTFERLVPGSTAGYFGRVSSTVLPNIRRLLETFRSRGRPVVYCIAGSFTEDGRDLPSWLKDFNGLSTMLLGERSIPATDDPSYQVDESVSPLPGEMVLNKTSSGPLASTGLDQLFHNMGVDSLVVCGLTTAVCVTQTARELADRGFRVVVAEDACTEMSEEMHEAALLTFRLTFGRTRRTEEVPDLLGTQRAAAPAQK